MHDKALTTSNQNRVWNKKAGPSMPGGPKDTSMGKNLSRDATNTLGDRLQQSPISPSANANSRNGG